MRIPYAIAGHIANMASHLAPAGGGKVARSLAIRRGARNHLVSWGLNHRDRQRPLAWIHAPSVGEGLMAVPVIDRIRHAAPDVQLVYTYFSPSAETLAALLPVDFAGVLPFDTAGAATALLDAVCPTAVVFSKLDVWPLLAEAAAARHIATGLISASLSRASGRNSGLAALLLRDAYASLTAVGAVHADDADRLAALGARRDRIVVTGDTRFDQVWARVNAPSANATIIRQLTSNRPTLVAGSTWPADDTHLLVAFSVAAQREPRARLIVAPHELGNPQREQARQFAERAGLTFANLTEATAATDIVWVDRMGVLADLYQLATVAYVGGGFHSKGLHSVIEPAAYGAPVLVGPEHTQSRDALALLAAGGAFAVGNGQEFSARLTTLLTSAPARDAAGTAAIGVVKTGLGAAARSTALVERLLSGGAV